MVVNGPFNAICLLGARKDVFRFHFFVDLDDKYFFRNITTIGTELFMFLVRNIPIFISYIICVGKKHLPLKLLNVIFLVY